jgi:hypothetical protein
LLASLVHLDRDGIFFSDSHLVSDDPKDSNGHYTKRNYGDRTG